MTLEAQIERLANAAEKLVAILGAKPVAASPVATGSADDTTPAPAPARATATTKPKTAAPAAPAVEKKDVLQALLNLQAKVGKDEAVKVLEKTSGSRVLGTVKEDKYAAVLAAAQKALADAIAAEEAAAAAAAEAADSEELNEAPF
jgi:hypothetical protein